MSKDLRKYNRQTQIQLIIGTIIIIFIIGDGLIYLIYGPAAAISGLTCIGIGIIPVLMVGLILALISWIVKKTQQDE